MSSVFTLSLFLVAAAVVGAGAEVLSCSGSSCEEDEKLSYMSLLQLKTEHNASSKARPQYELDENGEFIALKKHRPYYHTTLELHDEVERLSKDCGGMMTTSTHEGDGVSIDLVRLKHPNATAVNRVFILFGEHSRELIGPESGMRLLKLICGQAALTGLDSKISVAQLLQDNEFQMVLNANPHSRKKVEGGDYCLRTNPNGVDLNRNWEEGWTESHATDTNGGPKPFSEEETKLFKKMVEDFKPTTFLTVHSGTRGMYMPWAYDMEHAANYNAPLMLSVLKDLDAKHCKCPYGAAGKEVGYPCPGTCLDWVYSKLKTPFVFAWEIYVDDRSEKDESLSTRYENHLDSDSSQLTEQWNNLGGNTVLLQENANLGHEHYKNLFEQYGSDFVSRRASDKKLRDVSERKGGVLDRAAQEAHDESCFAMFNPDTNKKYEDTVQNWAVAYLEMAHQISGHIKKDSTVLGHMQELDYKVY